MKTDIEIQKDIIDELQWDPRLLASEIGVAVKNGIATLSGQVDSYAKKIAAENAAKRIKEVKGVVEDVEVVLPNHIRRTDHEIAETALRSLKWSTSIPEDKVRVIVEDGWVTLEGQVAWEFEAEEAKKAIEHNKGVLGITNRIEIAPQVSTPVVKEAIKKALERNADVEAENIHIDVKENKVTLNGKVHTWREMHEVWNAVWNAPGVTSVENNLVIS